MWNLFRKQGKRGPHTCHSCGAQGCSEAYCGLEPIGDLPANRTIVCRACYRKQFRRQNPGAKLPV